MTRKRTNELFFFFNDTATTEIYTLSLHDALPISPGEPRRGGSAGHAPFFPRVLRVGTRDPVARTLPAHAEAPQRVADRSEEHTSELQSRQYLVCRLLLEKKKKIIFMINIHRKHK